MLLIYELLCAHSDNLTPTDTDAHTFLKMFILQAMHAWAPAGITARRVEEASVTVFKVKLP